MEDDFWVGSLPNDIDPRVVFDACDPACFNFRPARPYGMRYAFCRKVRPAAESYYEWDNDVTIGTTLFLSRLIRPTTIANAYAARLFFVDGRLSTIVPAHTRGIGAYAWVVASDDWRDWLSTHELKELGQKLPLYLRDAPGRVRRARKHLDHAFHAFYVDQRFASLVTSFESLLKTSEYKSRKQFSSRAPRLATTLGLELISTECEEMYTDRSNFAHGSEGTFRELSDSRVAQYERFERVIRLALLRASTEPQFAALFSSTKSVEDAFSE